MLDLELTRSNDIVIVRITGSVISRREVDTVASALEFVPEDEHLVIDLGDAVEIEPSCLADIERVLRQRSLIAEAAIVSSRPEITLQLVVHGLDRLVPVVPTVDHAAAIVRARCGRPAA
jgi:hypothetical protein